MTQIGCKVQRRIATRVPRIDIGARCNKEPGHFFCSLSRCRMKSRPAKIILQVDVSPFGKEQSHSGGVPLPGGKVQGCLTFVICLIDVGTPLKERPQLVRGTFSYGPEK